MGNAAESFPLFDGEGPASAGFVLSFSSGMTD
jgi:hypothetical protein